MTALPHAVSQQAPLTLIQVENLIKVQAPDTVIHDQIQKRGLSFEVTPAVMDRVAKLGASADLLGQLRAQIRAGSVEVHTLPLATLTIDATKVGAADDHGVFVSQDLAVGTHDIAASHPGYKDANISVSIANHETRRLEIPLKWHGGYLTVTTIPEDAEAEVTGPQTMQGPIKVVPCLPGSYTIEVSHPGMETQTRTITVPIDETHTESFHLIADPHYLAQRIALARQRLQQNDRVEAFKIAASVYKLDAKNLDALTIMTRTSFELGETQAFLTFARAVLRSGASVALPLRHLDTLPAQKLHDVVLVISNSGIAIRQQPIQPNCRFDGTLIPFSSVAEILDEQNPRLPLYLYISYSTTSADGSTQGAVETFTLNESVVQRPNSRELMDSVVQLIKEHQLRP